MSPRATSTEEPDGGNLLVRIWRGAGVGNLPAYSTTAFSTTCVSPPVRESAHTPPAAHPVTHPTPPTGSSPSSLRHGGRQTAAGPAGWGWVLGSRRKGGTDTNAEER